MYIYWNNGARNSYKDESHIDDYCIEITSIILFLFDINYNYL